jgi:hypothetical protein
MIPPVATQIADILRTKPAVRALLLGGSHGNGLADTYSDLDFILVTNDGTNDTIASEWQQTLTQIGEVILWRNRVVAPVLINAIVAPDIRIDALIYTPDQTKRQTQDSVLALFDHDDIFASLPKSRTHAAPDPKRMAYQFEEFIRILGLLPLAIGREEYINGVAGVFHLRNLLVELLIAETNAPNRGGALQLNRLLTADQQDLLVSLPPPIATRDGVIDAHRAYPSAYLHRARDFAREHDIDWPAQFEDVVLTHIGQTLDFRIY